MAIHRTNLRRPESIQDFLQMNTKGETTTPNGFRDSTDRAPWAGNHPGVVGSYGATDVQYEDYDGPDPETFDYDEDD